MAMTLMSSLVSVCMCLYEASLSAIVFKKPVIRRFCLSILKTAGKALCVELQVAELICSASVKCQSLLTDKLCKTVDFATHYTFPHHADMQQGQASHVNAHSEGIQP